MYLQHLYISSLPEIVRSYLRFIRQCFILAVDLDQTLNYARKYLTALIVEVGREPTRFFVTSCTGQRCWNLVQHLLNSRDPNVAVLVFNMYC